MKKKFYKASFMISLIAMLTISSLTATAQLVVGPNPRLGGYVFYVSKDGKSGLLAETIDQGRTSWNNAQALISDEANHSADGKKVTGWRLPSIDELKKMYSKKDDIGSFDKAYWSSNISGTYNALVWNCKIGVQDEGNREDDKTFVRSIRTVYDVD